MRIKLLIWSLLVLFNLWYVITLQLSVDKNMLSNYLFNASYAFLFLFAAASAFQGFLTKAVSPSFKKGMIFFTFAFLSYATALFIWTFYNVILKQPIPYPGISDVFFILFQPSYFIGFIFIVRGFGGRFTIQSVIEFLLLFVIIFGMLYSFLSLSSIGPDLPFLERTLNILNPALDAALVSLAITGLRTERGKLHMELLIFVFAAVLMAFGDTVFSYRSANGLYWNGDLADVLYFVSVSIQGLGILSIVSPRVASKYSEQLIVKE